MSDPKKTRRTVPANRPPRETEPEDERYLRLSLDDQMRSLASILPQGEHARDQVENGLVNMMDEEPLWPLLDRPASPHLAHFAGFDVDEEELENEARYLEEID